MRWGSVALIRSFAGAYGAAISNTNRYLGRMKSPRAAFRSVLHGAVQFGFGAIRVLECNAYFIAIECKRPSLRFAAPEDSAFDCKCVLVQPALFGGIDPVIGRRASPISPENRSVGRSGFPVSVVISHEGSESRKCRVKLFPCRTLSSS